MGTWKTVFSHLKQVQLYLPLSLTRTFCVWIKGLSNTYHSFDLKTVQLLWQCYFKTHFPPPRGSCPLSPDSCHYFCPCPPPPPTNPVSWFLQLFYWVPIPFSPGFLHNFLLVSHPLFSAVPTPIILGFDPLSPLGYYPLYPWVPVHFPLGFRPFYPGFPLSFPHLSYYPG